MPIAFSVDRARRRTNTAAEGSVTYPEIVAHLERERDQSGLPFPELIEAATATVAISASEVRLLVDRLRDLGRRNALGPTAVVVGDDLS